MKFFYGMLVVVTTRLEVRRETDEEMVFLG